MMLSSSLNIGATNFKFFSIHVVIFSSEGSAG